MIIKTLLLTFLFVLTSFAQDFKISSYNIENLFDLKRTGTEYKEYIPHKKSNWNQETYTIKLKNISNVIKDLDSDIVALQEVESKKALLDLLQYLPLYHHHSFVKNKQSAIGLAVISKYPIIKTQQIEIRSNKKYLRPIQKTTFNINNSEFIIFNNHWRSKKASENERIEYALSLQNYLKTLPKQSDYVLLGDFNSNYNEYQTFKHDKKLNNTYGITGINQVLNTTIDKKFIHKQNILSFERKVHYNLWLELPYHDRYSYFYKQEKNTPDHILLNSALFDNKKISYINNSFEVFRPSYLFKNKQIYSWQTKGKKRVHKGLGYSDHLPISATFSTHKRFKHQHKRPKSIQITSIKDLYKKDTLTKKTWIYNAVVIYKYKNNAIIKQKNGRAIYLYKEAKNLKLGSVYDITVSKIISYNGLKEIVKIDKYLFKKEFKKYKLLFLDTNTIDIHNPKYQNEIITNLTATFKKGYLHYKFQNKNKKIKLYAKDINLLPQNGQKVTIISAHLGFYKSKPQIIIYKKNDIAGKF